MAWRRGIAATMLAVALGACAELRADAPLFAVSDQIGPPPLTEGVWIAVGEDCPSYYARRGRGRYPEQCSPMDLRRGEDGAWRMRPRVDLMSNLNAQERAQIEADFGPARVIIAPAVEHPLADGYSPLYVAEVVQRAEDRDAVGYAVIAPMGAMPATSALVLGSIGCDDILRDGPIEGVTAEYTAAEEPASESGPSATPGVQGPPALSGCVAATQASVREAARRAVLQNLEQMMQVRFVYVRPQ